MTDQTLSSEQKHRWAIAVTSICACLFLIACSWFSAPLPQILFGHDLIVLLDSAWKLRWGIIPSHNYCSVIGPFVAWVVYVGMRLAGSVPMAAPIAICLFSLFSVLPITYAAFSRMHPLAAGLATISLMASILAPHVLRFAAGDFSYSVVYDRWGYCLFIVTFIIVALPRPDTNRWLDVLDGVIAGSFVVISIFTKISYGLLLISVVFGFSLLFIRQPFYYLALCASGIIALAACGWLIAWDYPAFVHDIRLFAHARWGLGLHGFEQALLFIWPDVCLFLSLGLLAFLAQWLTERTIYSVEIVRTVCVVCGSVLFALVIMMSNGPVGGLRESPMLAIGGLIVFSRMLGYCKVPANEQGSNSALGTLQWVSAGTILLLFLLTIAWAKFYYSGNAELLRNLFTLAALLALPLWMIFAWPKPGARNPRFFVSAGAIIALLIVAPSTFRDLDGMLLALNCKSSGRTLPADQVFQAGELKGIQIAGTEVPGHPSWPMYVSKVEDGIHLLESTNNGDKAVLSFDFANPFNIMRGVKPPEGSPLAWQIHFVFSSTSYPDENQVFSGAEVVMIPKAFGSGGQDNLDLIDRLYGPYLRQHYKPAGESAQWSLYELR